jgi:aspartyl-tRNA(Asn)/glutamyl-tRNA(Gln) amidotransferase subunit B
MNYEIIIGLEVHLQSKTASKMFCRCDTKYFGDKPNTHTCPVCLGLPGALPVPNRDAIDHAVRMSQALHCTINKETKFDRKNYFYPDLAKSFQISQYDQPIGEHGYIEIETKKGIKKIGITRVHQEEDTGKSIHDKGVTLLDYNKSGMPLVEIVSEPDMNSKDDVNAYAKALKLLAQYLEVSDADMEKGQMRFEINMSLRKPGETELPNYKVEVKNIGSISVLEKVVETEYVRQSAILDKGETPVQETRGLVDMTGKTQTQRVKETAADYRYFPEPDIPPIVLDDEYLAKMQASIPELALEKKLRLKTETGLNDEVLDILVNDLNLLNVYNSLTHSSINVFNGELVKWLTGDYAAYVNSKPVHADFKNEYLVTIISLLKEQKVTRDGAKQILAASLETGKEPTLLSKEMNLELVIDTAAIDEAIEKVMAANEKAISDYKTGKNPNAAMFLVGQVMKEMRGRANAEDVKQKIQGALEK